MAKRMKSRADIFRKPRAVVSLFHQSEAGFGALAAVLVVMVLGAIILVPLLGFMITGQKAGTTVHERTTEFYSADAGVEKAIWWLQSFGIEDRSLWIDNNFFELPPEMTPPTIPLPRSVSQQE